MANLKAMSGPIWYLDSSVGLRVLLGHCTAAADWYDDRMEAGDAFVSSRVLHLEIVRVLRREALATSLADDFVAELTLLNVDNALLADAAGIEPHIKSLDAIHLASALRIGADAVTVVTHDANMSKVAETLGFEVHDPVAG